MESCNRWNKPFFGDLYEAIADQNIDFHFTGHLHLYQRYNTDIMHTRNHLAESSLDQSKADIWTFVIGCGGKIEDLEMYTKPA